MTEEIVDWTTLERQITHLWKSRGLEVLGIEVDAQDHGAYKWTILAKKKEEGD